MAYIEDGRVKVRGQNFIDIAEEEIPTLQDGSRNVYGGSECSAAKDGVTCSFQGRSFKISRKGVEVLK